MKNPGFAGALAGTTAMALVLMAAGVDLNPDHAGTGVTIALVSGLMAGGCCGLALKRGLRGAGSGFWHSVPGRWLIGRMAGLAVITGLLWPVWTAVKYGMTQAVIGAVHVFGIEAFVAVAPVIVPVAYVLTGLLIWRLRTLAKIALGKGSRPFRRWYRSFNMGRGGSSNFAGIAEIWANRWKPGMIFLGHSMEDRHWPVGVKDDRMMMTLAGNGGGKGEAAIIPNLLTYRGSVFCNDTKGQNAAVTAEPRRAMGQDVYVLAPFAEETAHLNPLAGVDPGAMDYVERIRGIVEALVIMGDDKNRVWSEWSKIVIEGLTDFAIRYDDGEFEPPEETGDAQ